MAVEVNINLPDGIFKSVVLNVLNFEIKIE
jgi:hypothetical protein